MALFRKAERRKAKLRLGISGPSGAGKTYSSLLIASGMVPMEKVAVIDSENGSADLYAQLGDYSVMTISPPYTPEKYIDAIKAAEQEGFEVIIIDSLTHAWAGEGGILDQQGKATDAKYKGNSWSAWREFTPRHNQLVEAMLKSKCHIIATMRSKMEHIQTEENGKKAIKKVGMTPIQREGMEYEMTVFLDLSPEHIATASKDRTSMFDGQYFKPGPETGEKLLEWLESGVDAPAVQTTAQGTISFSDAQKAVAAQKAVERQTEHSQLNWAGFWSDVKNVFLLDESEVHDIAEKHFGQPINSLTDVISTQQELNRFKLVCSKHKKPA